MILKTLTHDHEGSETWNWYDNIESASAYYDVQSDESVVSVKLKGAEASVVLVITDVAYLCNDEGKTIEKLLSSSARRERRKSARQSEEVPEAPIA